MDRAEDVWRASVSSRLAGHGAHTRAPMRSRSRRRRTARARSCRSRRCPAHRRRRRRGGRVPCVPSRPIACLKRKSVPPPSVSRGPTVARAHPPPCSPSQTRPPRVSSRNHESKREHRRPLPRPVPPPPPSASPGASAIAGDNDLAQTAALSGGDLLLRGALAMTALGGAAFVSRGASAKTSAVMDSGGRVRVDGIGARRGRPPPPRLRLNPLVCAPRSLNPNPPRRPRRAPREALERQQTVASDLGARVSRSEADAARFKAEASAARGASRATSSSLSRRRSMRYSVSSRRRRTWASS